MSEVGCRASFFSTDLRTRHEMASRDHCGVERPPPPPCPAPCYRGGTELATECEVTRLNNRLRQLEEDFKVKVTECAVLRVELMDRKEELEEEKRKLEEARWRLRQLEARIECILRKSGAAMVSWNQEMQREAHLRTLEANLADANRELAEMRELIKNQQNYRSKYLQAQARVEELARQMDSVQLDNTRISEQINLEIQCVKVKFQEKLQQLAPIPEMLKNSEARLRDSLQAQAIAEHKCEQLSRELNSAREKIHTLLRSGPRPPPEPKNEEARQAAVLMQRLAQLNDANKTLQSDVERLKNNVIQAEEYVMQNEKRLMEKTNECTRLAGDLERAQDQAARAIVNAERRAETACQCLKTTVTELERQIAEIRTRIATVEKDREEIQKRLQGQVQNLNENLQHAQCHIGSLEIQLKSTPGYKQ